MRATQIEPRHAEEHVVALFARGALMKGDFHCASCGYGIVCRGVLPTCPMCHEATWASPAWPLD